MKNNTCFNDDGDCDGVLLHCSKEDLPALSQDAERILNDTPTPRQPVIKDSLVFCHLALCVGFHEVCAKSKRIVA